MIGSYLIGIIGVVTIMAGWIAVQSLWRKTFSDHISDEDVLAGRSDCGSCGCTTVCKNKRRPISTKHTQKI